MLRMHIVLITTYSCTVQLASFCVLPRTTAIKRRVAERGGHGLTSFSTQTRGTPHFTTVIFHPSSWSWQPIKYPLLSRAVHRKSRWTLRFAKIVWTSVIYVFLLILSYIYFLYFRFEEQTNKISCHMSCMNGIRAWTNVRALESSRTMIGIWTRIFAFSMPGGSRI